MAAGDQVTAEFDTADLAVVSGNDFVQLRRPDENDIARMQLISGTADAPDLLALIYQIELSQCSG